MTISVKQLQFEYAATGSVLSIHDVSIQKGECVVLCGKSGSGKSTFLRLINGLNPEYYTGALSGKMNVLYLDVGSSSVEELSQVVGSIFQNPSTQFFHEQVEDELVFPCENQGLPVDVINCRLDKIIKQFHLQKEQHKSLHHLSGGQRQKVAIATALMQQPEIIVMDEPTANLDDDGVIMVCEMIAQLKNAGITVIVAEQRLAYLEDLADKYFYFDNGMLVQQWTKEMFQQLTIEQLHDKGLRARQLTNIQNDLFHRKQQLVQQQQSLQSTFTIKEAQLAYQDTVIANISGFQLPLGNIIGIVGKNGTGKTTLVKHLAGLLQNSGSYYWDGRLISAKERLQQSAIVLQDVRMQLFSETVEKEIELGADITRLARDKAMICDTLGLVPLLQKHPMTLSGGQMQRVMIANALLSNKKLLIFDEITSGLCYENMSKVAQLIKQLKQPDNLILLVSHDEEFLAETTDYILDMTML